MQRAHVCKCCRQGFVIEILDAGAQLRLDPFVVELIDQLVQLLSKVHAAANCRRSAYFVTPDGRSRNALGTLWERLRHASFR